MRIIAILLAVVAPWGAFAQTDGGVRELPINADYCAIMRALTNSGDPRCPMVEVLGQTRGGHGDSQSAVPPGAGGTDAGYFVRFAFDSSELTPAYQAHLKRLSEAMGSDALAGSCLKLVGHTDTVGQDAYNLTLSNQRVQSVRLYLLGPMAMAPTHILGEGVGEAFPLPGLAGSDPRNRRVEILARSGAAGCGA